MPAKNPIRPKVLARKLKVAESYPISLQMSKKYLIKHEREQCIGCGACASVCPKFWRMNPDDNMADLIGAKKNVDGTRELEIEENDFECNMNASESCPVNIIHISNKENGEQLI